MNSRVFSIVLSLGFIVILIVSYQFSLPEPAEIYVQESKGGTVAIPGNVVLKGYEVLPGLSLEVFADHELRLRTRTGGLKFSITPGSRFRHRGYPFGARSVGIQVFDGSGKLWSDGSTTVVIQFDDQSYVHEKGSVKWSNGPSEIRLTINSATQGHWLRENDTSLIRNTPPGIGIRTGIDERVPFKSDSLKIDKPMFTSLIPGAELKNRINKYAQTNNLPETVKEVFGHWVRDRWGNVYLYKTTENSFIVQSAGPDERIYTEDDRTWTGKLN